MNAMRQIARKMTLEDRQACMERKLLGITTHAARLGFEITEQTAAEFRRAATRDESMGCFHQVIYIRYDDWDAWACDVLITVNLMPVESTFGLSASCEVSWSATGRSVSRATAAVKLYERAIELASWIESIIQR